MTHFIQNGQLFVLGPDNKLVLQMPYKKVVKLLGKVVSKRVGGK